MAETFSELQNAETAEDKLKEDKLKEDKLKEDNDVNDDDYGKMIKDDKLSRRI